MTAQVRTAHEQEKPLISRWFPVVYSGAAAASVLIYFAEVTAAQLVPFRLASLSLLVGAMVAPIAIFFAYLGVRVRMSRVEAAQSIADVGERRRAIEKGLRLPVAGAFFYVVAWIVGLPVDLLITGFFVELTADDFIVMCISTISVVPVLATIAFMIVEDQMRPLLRVLQQGLPDSDRGRAFAVRRFSIPMRVTAVFAALVFSAVIMLGSVAYRAARDNVSTAEVVTSILPMAVILAVFSTAIAAALVTSLRRSISAVVDEVQAIAESDFSRRPTITTTDELGELMVLFDRMLFAQSTLIRETVAVTQEVAESAVSVSAGSEQSSVGVEQISLAMQDIVAGSQHQFAQFDRAKGAAERLEVSTTRASEAVSATAESASYASALAADGSNSARQAREAMELIRGRIDEASGSVEQLGSSTANIGTIVDTIVGIAAQTNLLALNAAVEAAHAGEIGGGFAVVAEQVRQLASDSKDAASRIGVLVGQIESRASEVVTAVRLGNQEVISGTNVVDEAGTKFDGIADALKEISSLMRGLQDSTHTVDAATTDVGDAIREIVEVTESFAALAQETSANTEEASAAAEEISASIHALALAAKGLEERGRLFKT